MTTTPSSPETQQEAMKIAKATQKQGQTKEETKLIAQGIEKGIALYKKQQKAKARERDKDKKKQQRQKNTAASPTNTIVTEVPKTKSTGSSNHLPWILLLLSWIGFVGYLFMT
ncbi:DUF2956 domain-containing protein [Enterovibrio makurazakiensis]|uniref:DUF2956 domain-containing protein n=1 Tax=Enterovibrio gelatinilyticus TaxID=2899819 RepID=A0ABT5QX23_9GAMM|nr:DUF2956 domain-containing protein [Enterovibrio sp. ZSDZ42]MDD1792574.1 DUF2956 domain-containing protein [Enterovibrio sp. ZSDZ42]